MTATPVTTVNDQMTTYFGGGAINDSIHSFIANSANVSGTASPEGAETADPGVLYRDTTNANLYIKVSGSGDTGWGAFSRVPVASITTFTQTYNTTATTVPVIEAAAVPTDAAAALSFGYTEAQANAIVASINNLVTAVTTNRKLVNKIIDVLQAAGLAL